MVQWRAFVGKGKLDEGSAGLGEIVEDLRGFFQPVIVAIAARKPLPMVWPCGGPWRRIDER
jgi:hypothetical protein